LTYFKARVQVQESKIQTMETQLQLKVAENQKLATLCDELISSMEQHSVTK